MGRMATSLFGPQILEEIRVIVRKTTRPFERVSSEDRNGDVVSLGSATSVHLAGHLAGTVDRQQQQRRSESCARLWNQSDAVTNGEGGGVKGKGAMSN